MGKKYLAFKEDLKPLSTGITEAKKAAADAQSTADAVKKKTDSYFKSNTTELSSVFKFDITGVTACVMQIAVPDISTSGNENFASVLYIGYHASAKSNKVFGGHVYSGGSTAAKPLTLLYKIEENSLYIGFSTTSPSIKLGTQNLLISSTVPLTETLEVMPSEYSQISLKTSDV